MSEWKLGPISNGVIERWNLRLPAVGMWFVAKKVVKVDHLSRTGALMYSSFDEPSEEHIKAGLQIQWLAELRGKGTICSDYGAGNVHIHPTREAAMRACETYLIDLGKAGDAARAKRQGLMQLHGNAWAEHV